MAADELEEMKKNSKYMKAQDVAPSNDADGESEKEKKVEKIPVKEKATPKVIDSFKPKKKRSTKKKVTSSEE